MCTRTTYTGSNLAKNNLIVDESGTMRKVIMRGLRQTGIDNANQAADGVEGMRAPDATSFDLILADVDMPDLNALDFTKAVAAKLPTPPPIAM